MVTTKPTVRGLQIKHFAIWILDIEAKSSYHDAEGIKKETEKNETRKTDPGVSKEISS